MLLSEAIGGYLLDARSRRLSPYTIIETGAWPSADLNRDGIVDFIDFAILADQWLETGP